MPIARLGHEVLRVTLLALIGSAGEPRERRHQRPRARRDPARRRGADRARGPAARHPASGGGALGSGAVYARNLPAPGSYRRSTRSSSREDVEEPQDPARRSRIRASARVLVPRRRGRDPRPHLADLRGHLHVGGDAGDADVAVPVEPRAHRHRLGERDQQPDRLRRRSTCARSRAIRNKDYFVDRESNFTNPTATAAAFQRYIWEIPLAYDDSLIGAVFAQTEETFLNLNVATAAAADLFSANPGAYSARTGGRHRVLLDPDGRLAERPARSCCRTSRSCTASSRATTRSRPPATSSARSPAPAASCSASCSGSTTRPNFGSTDFGGAVAAATSPRTASATAATSSRSTCPASCRSSSTSRTTATS
jgi:hypothetical protein